MIELIAWMIAVTGALAAVAAAQCLQFYVRRRWRVRVRLPDPVAYTDSPSFRCDAEIILRIHSSKPVRVRFSRCNSTSFITVHTVEASASRQPNRMDRWYGCDWKASVVLAADTLVPGFYRIDVEHRDDVSRNWCMCLLVRPVVSQPVVVVAPTNTWNAYNDFGGLSNYRDHATPLPLRPIRGLMRWFNVRLRIGDRHWLFAVPLPERRPNSHIHRDLVKGPGEITDASGEVALIRFLERENILYTIISDRDFAYEINFSRTRIIIFSTHSEYWSGEMMGRIQEAIQRGCNIMFLSGNNMYRKIQFMATAISVIDMIIPQNQVVPLIGTYYDAYGWLTYDAYRVTDASHWCFEGLELEEGSEFGHSTPQRPGASGGETDKIKPGGEDFRVVAVGKNSEGPAFMVCRDIPRGGFIFNVGSKSFTLCLDDDPVIQKLVLNLIRRAVIGRLSTRKDLIGSEPLLLALPADIE